MQGQNERKKANNSCHIKSLLLNENETFNVKLSIECVFENNFIYAQIVKFLLILQTNNE